MLYIASALTPTPISHTVEVTGFTGPGKSLVIGKPDRIEIWDVTSTGLVYRADLEVWGSVAGLAVTEDARPHLLVLTGPPNARLLLVTWENGLTVTASQNLQPPTPLLRRQEFFTGVIAHATTALVSLWTGLLACVEMELEKVKDAKKRTSGRSKDDAEMDGEGRRLVFKTSGNIHIREHNLLDLAFAPVRDGESPVLMFLWMSETNKIFVQPRQLNVAQQRLDDSACVTDVVNPTEYPVEEGEVDFNDIPFSCPAGRNVLAIPGRGPRNSRLFLIIGDEHAVLYSVSLASSPTTETSPRASATRRSPQQETGGIGKKRKSSMSGRGVNTDSEQRWLVQPVWRVRQGWGTVLASTVLESHDTGGSVLLGDECGRLTAIGWEFDSSDAVRVSKTELGQTSPPTALTYIDNGILFVSSACGDSVLVDLSLPSAAPKSAGAAVPRSIKGKGRAHESSDGGAWTISSDGDAQGTMDVKERWLNIAPVKDFTPIKGDDGRVSHIVVASGSANTNSLRVIRSGAGLTTQRTVEGITGVQSMWSLPSQNGPDNLLLSASTTSAILKLGEDISLVQTTAAFRDTRTLAAGLVTSGDGLLQVTPSGITLWTDLVAGCNTVPFSADGNEIVAASVKGESVAAALRDGAVLVVRVAFDGLDEVVRAQLPQEVAAIDLTSMGCETAVAVSDWSGRISLYTTPGLSAGQPFAQISEAAYACSLLFQTSPQGVLRLLAGLSDGSLVTYNVDASADSLKNTRAISSLGSRPLQVSSLQLASDRIEEPVSAVGISERMTVLFESRNHLESSAWGKKGVSAAAAVTIPTVGPCVAVATAEGLTFERLTSLRKIQVLTLDLGETSSARLDYVSGQNLLAAGTITRSLDPDSGDVFQSSGVDIRRPGSLELLASHSLPPREAVTSVKGVFLNGRQYVAVGTAVFPTDEAMDESSLDEVSTFVPTNAGRLILLEAREQNGKWTLSEVVVVETKASVYDSAVIHGFLAIASAVRVSIFRLQSQPTRLVEVMHYSNAFEARYLTTMGPLSSMDMEDMRGPTSIMEPDYLVVGDGMRSIILLRIDEDSGKITAAHRDMAALSVRGIEVLSNDYGQLLVADAEENLTAFEFDEDENLEAGATFGLHDQIARLRTGSLAPVSSAPDIIKAKLLFATANGRLGVVGKLGDSAAVTLQELQRNMNNSTKGPGNMDWKVWRRGGTAVVPKDTAGFVDGDFVQRFLDMSDPDEVEAALLGSVGKRSDAVECVHRRGEKGGLEPASRDHVVRVLEAAAGLH